MTIEFRKAILPRELSEVLAFDAGVFTLPGDMWDAEDWIGFELYWMVVDGLKVGCCALQPNSDFDGEPKAGYLLVASIGVAPEQRRQGFGTRFTEWQIEYGRTQGFSMLVATTRESNASMIGLYKRLGFKVRCITDYYADPEERAVVFDLALTQAGTARR